MILIPSDFGCDDESSSPMLFSSPLACSTFSENVVNDFTSDDFFFSGDAFPDDDSPPDLLDLVDLAGDAFDGFVVVGGGGFRLFFVGVFRTGEIFVGESF